MANDRLAITLGENFLTCCDARRMIDCADAANFPSGALVENGDPVFAAETCVHLHHAFRSAFTIDIASPP